MPQAATDIQLGTVVELDERESNGIRVTLAWDRSKDTASVLVWDERAEQSFAIELQEGDDVYDVFNHPFAYAARRSAPLHAVLGALRDLRLGGSARPQRAHV